jgi:hypothetical protein
MRFSIHFFKVLGLVLVLSSLNNVKAQKSSESAAFAHQLSLQYGFFDMTLLEEFFRYSVDLDPMDINAHPGLPMLEYRLVRKRIGVGLTLGSRMVQLERSLQSTWTFGLQSREANYLMVMPSLEWYWVTQGNYVVSSQLGLGMRYAQIKETYFNGDRDIYREERFAFQISPLVVSYGGRQIQGRFDVGIGHKGFVALGLVYQFW